MERHHQSAEVRVAKSPGVELADASPLGPLPTARLPANQVEVHPTSRRNLEVELHGGEQQRLQVEILLHRPTTDFELDYQEWLELRHRQ